METIKERVTMIKDEKKDLVRIVKEVLDRYKDTAPNLTDDDLRQAMADEIVDSAEDWVGRLWKK